MQIWSVSRIALYAANETAWNVDEAKQDERDAMESSIFTGFIYGRGRPVEVAAGAGKWFE